MPKKVTTESFIQKANIIHNNKYDYSLVEYINSSTKVKIICKEHGIFEQTPDSHSRKRGCPKCAAKRRAKTQSTGLHLFIEKAKSVHGDKYNYSLVEYTNNSSKIKIVCKKHGEFKQSPYKHLKGQGCPNCKNKTTSNRMIKNNPGWTYTNWKKSAENSKHFDSFKVYIIKCFSDEEEFYKIGKTYNTVEKRFEGNKLPYNYKIVKEVKGGAEEVSKLERKLQKQNKEFKYIPKIKFEGSFECFKQVRYE